MKLNVDKNQIEKFLSALWGNADRGQLTLVSLFNGPPKSVFLNMESENSLKPSSIIASRFVHRQSNAYHTLGLLNEKPPKGRGKERDVIAIPGLWMDIDCAFGSHTKNDLPDSIVSVMSFLREFALKPSWINNSGGGLHVYWIFKEPWYFDDNKEREKAIRLSAAFQSTIHHLAREKYGWNLDITSDLVRLLRLPGTYNFKSEPVMVQTIKETGHRYNPDDFEEFLIDDPEIIAPKTDQKHISGKNHSSKRLEKVVDQCAFLRHCRDNAKTLSEPEWFCMIASLCLEGGSRPLIHHLSTPYSNYNKGETETKIRNCQDSQAGPILCQSIRNKTGFECPSGGCGVSNPIQLAYMSDKKKCEKSEITFDSDIADWPILNEKVLYGIAGEFVKLATENSEADPAAVLVTLLTRFGVECGPESYFMVGDGRHYPRIFSAIVGASSKARKGTSCKPVERLFDLNGIFEAKNSAGMVTYTTARHTPGPLSSGEGIVHAVRDASVEWDKKKKVHVESDPGIIDKRLYVQDEEFASALSCSKREGNTLSAILRNAWDNGTIDPLTKTTKIKATNAHIGICTHITRDELIKKLDETQAVNGFANRFLWVCARRQKLVPFPKPMPHDRLNFIQKQLMKVIIKAREAKRLRFSEETKDLWEAHYPELTKEHQGFIGSIIHRAEPQVTRLSMLYALLDGSEEIKPVHLEAALALWGYCMASVKFIFADKCADPSANRIIESLADGPKTKSELYDYFGKRIKGRQLNNALHELIASDKIIQEKYKTDGAPKTIFKLND